MHVTHPQQASSVRRVWSLAIDGERQPCDLLNCQITYQTVATTMKTVTTAPIPGAIGRSVHVYVAHAPFCGFVFGVVVARLWVRFALLMWCFGLACCGGAVTGAGVISG